MNFFNPKGEMGKKHKNEEDDETPRESLKMTFKLNSAEIEADEKHKKKKKKKRKRFKTDKKYCTFPWQRYFEKKIQETLFS